MEISSNVSTMIIAVCSVLSPLITVILNNRHQLKMRKLELEEKTKNELEYYHRKIYENYLSSAFKVVHAPTDDNLSSYAESLGLAFVYFPKELKDIILPIDRHIANKEYSKAERLLNDSYDRIRQLIDSRLLKEH